MSYSHSHNQWASDLSDHHELCHAEYVLQCLLTLPDTHILHRCVQDAQVAMYKGDKYKVNNPQLAKECYLLAAEKLVQGAKEIQIKNTSESLLYLATIVKEKAEKIADYQKVQFVHRPNDHSKPFVTQAKEHFQKAEALKSNMKFSESVEYYLLAAEHYQYALAETSDQNIKTSLAFLVDQAEQNAKRLESLISSDKKVSTTKTNTSSKGSSLEASWIGRLTLPRQKSRISGMEKIPTSAKSAIDEVKVLEAKLADIGLMKRYDILQDDAAFALTTESIRQKNNVLNSSLGESFMMLGGKGSSDELNSSRVKMSYSPSSKERSPRVTRRDERAPSPLSTIHETDISASIIDSNPYGNSEDGKRINDEDRANTNGNGIWNAFGLMGWGQQNKPASDSPSTSAKYKEAPKSNIKKPESVFEKSSGLPPPCPPQFDRMKRINSNNTMMIHSCSEQSLNNSALMSSTMWNPMQQSITMEQRNVEGERKLLESIKRLGEENAALLQKLDRLLYIQKENEAIKEQMSTFKADYSNRLSQLKTYLRNVGIEETIDNVNRRQNSTKGQGESVKSVNKEKDPRNKVALPLSEGNQSDPIHMQQLEKVVNNLMIKLDQAAAELREKNERLRKYESRSKESALMNKVIDQTNELKSPPRSPKKVKSEKTIAGIAIKDGSTHLRKSPLESVKPPELHLDPKIKQNAEQRAGVTNVIYTGRSSSNN